METFRDWFARTESVVTLFSQGVNQSARGTDKVNAMLNCHVATWPGRKAAGPACRRGGERQPAGRAPPSAPLRDLPAALAAAAPDGPTLVLIGRVIALADRAPAALDRAA